MSYKKTIYILIFLTTLGFSIQAPQAELPGDSIAQIANISIAPSKALAGGYQNGQPTLVTKVLSKTDLNVSGGEWAHELYDFSKSLVNIILLIALIFFAFANILHINIETYAIKKVLPKLVVAGIVANLAMPIFALVSRIVDTTTVVSFFRPHVITIFDVMGVYPFFGMVGIATFASTILALGAISAIWVYAGVALLIGLILIALPSILIFILNFIFAFRPYILYIGAGVAPIFIALSVLPQTEPLFKRWFKIVVFWMFYPLIVWGLINLMSKIPNMDNLSGDYSITSGIVGIVIPIGIRTFLLYLAARAPFLWEKDIGNIIQKAGDLGGKAIWTGVGAGINLAYLHRNARGIREKDRSMSEMRKGLGGDTEALEKVAAVREGRIEKEKEEAKAKETALTTKYGTGVVPPEERLSKREEDLIAMSPARIKAEAGEYAGGLDIEAGLDDFEKERIHAHIIEIGATADLAAAVDAPLRTKKQAEDAKFSGNKPAIETEARKRAAKDRELQKAELEEGRIVEYGGASGFAFDKTDKWQKVLWGLMRGNPFGAMATIRDKREFVAKESQKTYDKYSAVGSYIRGKISDTKLHQGIVKEDLGELGTAEQMTDYCNFHMKQFYAQVRRTLTEQGMLDVTEEQAVSVGNRMLRQFRTDVKGTKDYLAHPYFRGLDNRTIATVIEGDYNISRQIATEMRRGNRTVEIAQVEQNKKDMYMRLRGASEMSETGATREHTQAEKIIAKTEENLLLRIARATSENPGIDPTTLARAMASQVSMNGLNRDDFHRRNVETIMPAIAREAQVMKVNIDVNAALQGGQALNTGQIESALSAHGVVTNKQMETLLRQYTINAIAGLAVASHASEGTITAGVAKKITDSNQPPEDIAGSVTTLLGGKP